MFRRLLKWLLSLLRRSGDQLERRLAADSAGRREWVALAASRDPARWNLSCAWYCEEGSLVATDGHRMHILRNAHDVIPRRPVDASVMGAFPDWKNVYPEVARTVVVDAIPLMQAIRSVVPWLDRPAEVRNDGQMILEARERILTLSSAAGQRTVALVIPAELPRVGLNPRDVLEALRGATGVIWIETGAVQYSPVLFRRSDASEAVIMPIRL